MAELKYKKYILTDLKLTESQKKNATEYNKWATRILSLGDEAIEGTPHIACSWYFKAPDEELEVHTHDFDEVLAFFGNDPQNPHDLGGEIEFWLEDEQYVITNSCFIFIPKGLKHCPLKIKKVERPIFHFGVTSSGKYSKFS